MHRLTIWMTALLLLLSPSLIRAQEPVDEPKAEAKDDDETEGDETPERKGTTDEEPVVTEHELTIGGRTLSYTATAGLMPIRNAKGETEARIFYIAYTLDRDEDEDEDEDADSATRPLLFSFNGGPGSASLWLHLGALGPRRVALPDGPTIPAPPYRLVDNESTWLDRTDLVFIDPVGTGFSRAEKPDLNRKFHGLSGDIESVGEFIRMYLSRNGRWSSPLYLIGESYGTTRAAGLAGHLIEAGIAFNGIILVSCALDFQSIRFGNGNDLPFVLYLPSYAATAWFHKRLPDDLQGRDLRDVLDEVERWADDSYRDALGRGDRLSDEDRAEVVRRLARYTGLEESTIEENDLRVTLGRFCASLLRDRKRSVGRYDSRYEGIATLPLGDSPDFDPSYAAVRPAFTATMNQYLRDELEYVSDVPYYILGEGVGPWDWGPSGQGYPRTSDDLREAMAKNPHMKVLIASGYYDLATPFRAIEDTIAHLSLDPSLRENVRFAEFEAGHMMYLHAPSLAKLKDDGAKLLDDASD